MVYPVVLKIYFSILRLKCDGTRAETRFRLSAKRTSPFKPAGASVQSTTGSRGVRISGSNAGYTVFRGSVRIMSTHSIRQFPLHFPSRASPCAIRFQLDSTYSECVCSLSYPAYKAHAPYCFICCLPGSTLFFHITSQTAGFSRKKVIRHKLCVLTFSTSFV